MTRHDLRNTYPFHNMHAEIGRELDKVDAAMRDFDRAERRNARNETLAMLAVLAMAAIAGAMLGFSI